VFFLPHTRRQRTTVKNDIAIKPEPRMGIQGWGTVNSIRAYTSMYQNYAEKALYFCFFWVAMNKTIQQKNNAFKRGFLLNQ